MNDLITNKDGAPPSLFLAPVISIKDALARRNDMLEFVRGVMLEGIDFGTIPGTAKRGADGKDIPNMTLLKPGAEKFVTFFGLTASFTVVESIEDWSGIDHAGEPFFSYWYRCTITRYLPGVGDWKICDADGSANSWEKKYRWRNSDRICPSCGKAAIKKSGFADRDTGEIGWYCHGKIGGCGAKFGARDMAILSQETGNKPNPDIFDTVNTLIKMSTKRAMVAAVLIACNASDYFTQDMEDKPDYEKSVSVDTGEIQYTQKTEPPKQRESRYPSQDRQPVSAQRPSTLTNEEARKAEQRRIEAAREKAADTSMVAEEENRVANIQLLQSRIKKLGEMSATQVQVLKAWIMSNQATFDCPFEQMNKDQITMINNKLGELVKIANSERIIAAQSDQPFDDAESTIKAAEGLLKGN